MRERLITVADNTGFQSRPERCDLRRPAFPDAGRDRERVATPALPNLRPTPQLADTARPRIVAQRRRAPHPASRGRGTPQRRHRRSADAAPHRIAEADARRWGRRPGVRLPRSWTDEAECGRVSAACAGVGGPGAPRGGAVLLGRSGGTVGVVVEDREEFAGSRLRTSRGSCGSGSRLPPPWRFPSVCQADGPGRPAVHGSGWLGQFQWVRGAEGAA